MEVTKSNKAEITTKKGKQGTVNRAGEKNWYS